MLAQELKRWGEGTFQQQLDKAYKDFTSFCRAKKLHHSQPPFKVSKMTVPWLAWALQLCLHSMNLKGPNMIIIIVMLFAISILFWLRLGMVQRSWWTQRLGMVESSAVGYRRWWNPLPKGMILGLTKVVWCWPLIAWPLPHITNNLIAWLGYIEIFFICTCAAARIL